jgi:putative SOS response-associated peptidase YedK
MSNHLKQCQTTSNNLKQSQTTSNNFKQPQTISNHLPMCGRYSFVTTKKQKAQLQTITFVPDDLMYSYNIAPTHQAYIITALGIRQMEWGLVPHWSKDGKNSGNLINARAEGIEEKPSFRQVIQSKRCLVPADSFYEWRKEPGGRKIPYRITDKADDLLFMAGIYDEWRSKNEIKYTFSIITTTPNQEMSDLHNRMPVILSLREQQQAWLEDGPFEPLQPLLKALPDHSLTMYPVSEALNKPGVDGPQLHERVAGPLTLF